MRHAILTAQSLARIELKVKESQANDLMTFARPVSNAAANKSFDKSAAAPLAGAPRTTMSLIVRATEAWP